MRRTEKGETMNIYPQNNNTRNGGWSIVRTEGMKSVRERWGFLQRQGGAGREWRRWERARREKKESL